MTGRKLQAKQYVRHSGYPGGMRTESLERLLARRPEEVIRRAVRGMVPQNRLGEQMMRKLHVYAGAEHPHAAQRPTELKEADSAMKSAPYFQGTGRRKTSIARVRLVPGEGTVVVNGKALDDYFGRDGATDRATLPFTVTNTARRFNAMIKVEGGGVTGQIGAIAHGIARALQQMDKELGPALRKAGLLTRDPRAKERKKPGLKRARKAPQFTKR